MGLEPGDSQQADGGLCSGLRKQKRLRSAEKNPGRKTDQGITLLESWNQQADKAN